MLLKKDFRSSKMPNGSCLCGKCKIEVSKIISTGICHCTLCRKMTGSLFSLNAIVPEENFTLQVGNPKKSFLDPQTKNSGFYFCGDCGSSLWNESVDMPGLKVLKAGVLDDTNELEDFKPKAEQFVARRPSWLAEVGGATQVDGMQSVAKEALLKKLERSRL